MPYEDLWSAQPMPPYDFGQLSGEDLLSQSVFDPYASQVGNDPSQSGAINFAGVPEDQRVISSTDVDWITDRLAKDPSTGTYWFKDPRNNDYFTGPYMSQQAAEAALDDRGAGVPETSLNWRQKMANAYAPEEMFPGTSQGQRDTAFISGLNRLGDVLVAAGLAPDKRSAARAMAQALPASRGAYQEALLGAMKMGEHQSDRAFQEEQRAQQRLGWEDQAKRRSREEAEREAVGSVDYGSRFSELIADKDLSDVERADFQLKFDDAVSRLEREPSPENADRMLGVMAALAKAANETEQFEEDLGRSELENARKMNMSVDEWKEFIKEKASGEIASIRQRSVDRAWAAEQREEARRQRERGKSREAFEDQVFEDFTAGKPTKIGEYTALPSSSGGVFIDRPSKARPPLSEIVLAARALRKDNQFANQLQMLQESPETPVPADFALKAAGVGVDLRAGQPLLPQQFEELMDAIRAVGGGETGNAGAQFTMDQVRNTARSTGKSVEEIIAAIEAKGGRVVE